MKDPKRRKAKWESRPHPVTPTPIGLLPEPPDVLGTWQWRQPGPSERNEDWQARTARQRQAILDAAAGWLRVGQAVKVHHDARIGGGDVAGRIGTIHRFCSPAFPDYASVQFPPRGRERNPRFRMLPLEILEPVV